MRARLALWLTMTVLAAGLLAPRAASGAFDPIWELDPSSRVVGANPRIDVSFALDPGEEPLDYVIISFNRKFSLPRDGAIGNGEELGQGQFTTATAPLCNPNAQATFRATLYERDRSAAEQDLWSVWVADLGPPDVVFPWTRFQSGRWRAFVDIPGNALACSPVTLMSMVNPASESGIGIVRNPRQPGNYTFKSILVSAAGSRVVVKDRYRFVEPGP